MVIGIWGDSIVYGSCDSEAMGWVGRLRKLFIDDDHELYNFGICGETSQDILRRFEIEAKAVVPDVIIYAVGINDTKYQDDATSNLVSADEYASNLKELIRQAHVYTTQIYLVGLTKVDEGWRSAKGSRFLNEDIEKYDKCCAYVAKEEGLPFISVFGLLNPDTDLADGLHPNSQGYEKLFGAIKSNMHLF